MNNDAQLNPCDYKIKHVSRVQYEFVSRCIDDLIPEDHKARLVWEFVNNMDLSPCLMDIFSMFGSRGRSTTNPRILLTLWIYTIMDGNTSARKLEELCKNHDVYRWICGGVSISRTTLAEFRSKNPRKFDELLTKCLAVMVKADLISDSDFSQDGTRIKANAGFSSFRREESLEKLEENLMVYLEKLREEEKSTPDIYERRKIERKKRFAIEKAGRVKAALENLNAARLTKATNGEKNNKKVPEKELADMRASTTDPQARKMKMGDGGFRLAYNVQFATGLDSRVIYGVDVVNGPDPGTAPRLMTQVMERLKNLKQKNIQRWIADSAYSAKSDIITVANLFPNCLYYAPPKPQKNVDPKKYRKDDCEELKRWRDLIDTDEVKELYKKRCSTAEFSNMQVKNHALNEFSVRGLLKVKGMAILHAISMNVSRWIDLLQKRLKEVVV
jgi:transposase